MPNYNKVILMGHLTREPELSYTPSQTAICKFGLAVNHKYKDKEDVCFVDCTAFGKQAENINMYLGKGAPVLIEGRLCFEQWETPEGQPRSKHTITIERFTFVSSKGKGEEF